MKSGAKYNVVCFGYNPWSNMWKRNQTMMSMLSRKAYVDGLLFLNPDVYLGDLLRNPARELSKFRRNYWRYITPKKVDENIEVLTPLILPRAARSRIVARRNRRSVEGVLRPYVGSEYILILNRLVDFSNSLFGEVFENASLKVFDWSDDFETFCASNEEKERCADIRRRYLKECDLVVTVNDKLTERAREINPNSYTVRNGTNYECLSKANLEETSVAPVIDRIPGPRIGYVGYLNSERLDLDLIDRLSRQRPNYRFVFVGPHAHKNPLGIELPRRENVFALPAVDYSDLPSVFKGFDVCIIPNRINEYTAGNDPIKLFDYLAAGRPVVSTATAGTEDFADVISIARSAEEFLSGIDEALANGASTSLREERNRRAKENSWPVRFERFSELLESRMGTASAERERVSA